MNKRNLLGVLSVILCFGVLTGCTQTQNTETKPTTTQKETYKEVSLSHDGWNTIPQVTTLPAGENYKFVITPESNGKGCMSTIKRAGTTTQDARLIIAGEPIEFVINDAQPGEYKLVCNGMGMEQGKIVIEA